MTLQDDYRPLDSEDYMNPQQRAYFKAKLNAMKQEIFDNSNDTIANLQQTSEAAADVLDRASSASVRAIELRTRDRQRKLVNKIDAALRRIDKNEYGYCEETGDPIGLRRLEARPTATLTIEAQERHEQRERTRAD